MPITPAETRQLLERSAGGDAAARHELLIRHRDRLRRVVAVRLDRRLMPRLDASDVVQEALAEAAMHLDDYFRAPPLPFFPWLRQFAWERLVKAHRRHIHARCRSIVREEPMDMQLSNESVCELARRLVAGDTSPSRNLTREEERERVRMALDRL